LTGEGFKQYAETLESLFPRSVPETIFIEKMSGVLGHHGFTPDNAINLVSTCRDELCRPFVQHLDKTWGHSFNISSLAGMVFCGRTGFKAAMAHAPMVDGKERYIFWVAPHMALPIHGETGVVYRPGREKPSTACGALLAILGEMKANKINMHLDPSDLEQSLVKQHVVSHLQYGHVPSLTELTYAAHACIVEEVLRTAEAAVDQSCCEFVIVSGIQIHGALGQNFFWPGTMTKFANGKQTDLYEEYAAEVAGWKLDGWVQGEALAELQDRERACRLAVEEGDVNKLLRAEVPLGQVLDHHRRSLLHIAALHGKVDVAKCLVGKASMWPEMLEMEDCFFRKALDYAVERGHDQVADVLVAMGCGLEGAYLIESMCAAVSQCDIAGVKRLWRFARDTKEAISVKDVDGRGLIHIAAGADHPLKDAMIDLLFSYGTQVTADFYGQVPRDSTELKRRSVDYMGDVRNMMQLTREPSSGSSTPVNAMLASELPKRRAIGAPPTIQNWNYQMGNGLADDEQGQVPNAMLAHGNPKNNLNARGGKEARAGSSGPRRMDRIMSRENSDGERLVETEAAGAAVKAREASEQQVAAASELSDRGTVLNIVRSILIALLTLMGLKGRMRIGATELLLGAAAIAAVIQRQRAGR